MPATINGASDLVPKDVLDRYGRDLVGRPDNAQFVLSKTELDNLVAKSGGNIAEMEKALGIPSGQWQGREMVRIDIPDPKGSNVRLPSGNEAGANEKWLPGGKTPEGYSEAIVNQVPKGKYIESSL
jgi:hypothetical protein